MNAEEKLFEAVIQGEELRTPGVHVTSLTFPCLRKGWFKRFLGEYTESGSMMTLYHGRAIHTIKILPRNEFELSWEGIVGRIDQYDPERHWLIELKSIEKIIPRYLPKKDHVEQVNAYNLLLVRNNYPPLECANLVYIEKAQPHNVADHDVTKQLIRDENLETFSTELLKRRDIILQKQDDPPPRVIGWNCDYCPFPPKCFSNFNSIQDLLERDTLLQLRPAKEHLEPKGDKP